MNKEEMPQVETPLGRIFRLLHALEDVYSMIDYTSCYDETKAVKHFIAGQIGALSQCINILDGRK